MEKERKKAEKEAKFLAKKAKAGEAAKKAAPKAEKKEKKKSENVVVGEYIEETPKGMKKSKPCFLSNHLTGEGLF